ncbi:60S ribosomal protein L34 [Senna tora]|uniref:60S ribosomal protein L34 n=1 Tax=Senna tora TaxID=362788 RepID=A0A834SIJ6_9FABA|nr:60S ribosomal protein L34 [Senna tora]
MVYFSPFMENPLLSRTPNTPQIIPTCDRTPWTLLESLHCILAIGACLYLYIPFTHYFLLVSMRISRPILYAMKEEVSDDPSIYIALGVGVSFASLAIWGIVAAACASRNKCGSPDCKGLSRSSTEFDIQLETEEVVKKEEEGGGMMSKGVFGVPPGRDRDHHHHHRELEAELKKIAPPNGRAVLVVRGRCGCCVGRLEVPGLPKKLPHGALRTFLRHHHPRHRLHRVPRRRQTLRRPRSGAEPAEEGAVVAGAVDHDGGSGHRVVRMTRSG